TRVYGGAGGIRTPGPLQASCFQGRCVSPLRHRSGTRLPRLDLTAERVDPLVGRLPLGLGVAAAGGSVLAGGRVGAEELHPGQLGVEVAEAVGDDLVGHVALEVDDEAVVTERLLGWPG